MKILHISTSDTGGASNACIRLHQGLLNMGVDSKVLVYLKRRNIPEVYQLYEDKPDNYFIAQYRFFKFGFHEGLNRLKLFGRVQDFELFTKPRSLLKPEQHYLIDWADIINLHWVAYFVNYPTFFQYIKKPIVWTLHDMNPFSGGCHHSRECDKFKSDCDFCPQLKGSIFPNYSNANFNVKQKVFENISDLNIVTPSMWLMQKSFESSLFTKFAHEHIPNGIDENVFKPISKSEARQKLGLPDDKKILLFTADWVERKAKGFIYLHEAVNKISIEQRPYLCVAGRTDLELTDKNILKLGYISDENTMSLVYSACDAMVLPSLEDNLPNTIIESLLCGTPVIAFPTGGIPEMITHGVNGILTKNKDKDSLHSSIDDFLEDKFIFNQKEISVQAIKKYGISSQSKQYIELYQKIIG